MAVDPDDVDQVAATVASIYREAETDLTRRIADRLGRGLDSPEWADRKLAAVKDLRKSAAAVIGGLQADSSRAIVEAASKSYRAGWSSALETLPAGWFGESGLPAAARRAATEVPGYGAIEALADSVQNDIGERSRNMLRDVVDDYRSVVTGASSRALAGTSTTRESAQATWQRLVDRGILGFTDRSGRRWQLSSYAEMATRTVTRRAAVTGQTDRLHAADVNLVYVSDHSQECQLCRPYEGTVLRIDDGPIGDIQVTHATTGDTVTVRVADTLDDARSAGFLHPNCRHTVSAYLPGVTQPPRQTTADADGDQARQRQRAIERNIRKYKSREAGALTEQDRKAARRKVRGWQAEMRDHLAANPTLKRLRYREQQGAGFTPPRGKRDDPAAAIGSPADVTLDGEATVARRQPRTDEDTQPEPAAPVDERQGDLFDTPPEAEPAELPPEPGPRPDFTALSDDALTAALDEYADNPDALESITAELGRREPPLPTQLPDFTSWNDDDLEAAVGDYADDPEAVDAIFAELDRRAEQPAEPETFGDLTVDDGPDAEKWAEVDRRAAEGESYEEAWADVFKVDLEKHRREQAIAALRDEGYKGRGLDELARLKFRDVLNEQINAAEDATRGFLFNASGQRKVERGELTSETLWRQNEAFARKWASDELKEWWDTHGRLTFDDWLDQYVNSSASSQERTGGDSFLR